MANTMEQSSFVEPDLSLKEWALKARISREKTSSRTFSASNLKSFREESRSFRSSMTISSTASSPGYTLRDEIDPSTYSFTTDLKALQAKAVYSWEYLSVDGNYALNSKWNNAEKYISNPLSGEVPLQCLSAKALSGITMSAPLTYPSHNHPFIAKSPISECESEVEVTSQEKKMSTRRDVGTQSMLTDPNWSSPSPSPSPSPNPSHSPSITENSVKVSDAKGEDYSSISSKKLKSETEVEVKETRENHYIKSNEGSEEREKQQMCLSLRALWKRTEKYYRDRQAQK